MFTEKRIQACFYVLNRESRVISAEMNNTAIMTGKKESCSRPSTIIEDIRYLPGNYLSEARVDRLFDYPGFYEPITQDDYFYPRKDARIQSFSDELLSRNLQAFRIILSHTCRFVFCKKKLI